MELSAVADAPEAGRAKGAAPLWLGSTASLLLSPHLIQESLEFLAANPERQHVRTNYVWAKILVHLDDYRPCHSGPSHY